MTRREGALLWMPRRPTWVLIAVTATVTALSPVFSLLGTPTITPTAIPVVPAVLGLALLALQLWHSNVAAQGKRPRRSGWTLLAMAALVYVPLPWFTYNWLATQALLMASSLMIFRGRRAFVAAAAPAVGTATYVPVHVAWQYHAGALVLAWDCGFWLLTLPMLATVLYAATRLTGTARELLAARAELAELALGQEQLRLSRDLHDLLGQSLAAVSLKSDLAIRLLAGDPVAARREVEGITVVAQDALHGVQAVTQNIHRADLRAELSAAARLLDAAQIIVHMETDTDDVAGAAGQVLAWAVREGVTNVLRHSSATRCFISIRHQAGKLILRIGNDGAASGPVGTGTGLAGIAERAAAAAGQMTVGPAPGGSFMLTVEIPLEAM